MAKHKTLKRNIVIKKTPRLYKYSVKMVQKIKPNTKKQYRRKHEKQQLSKNQDI